MPKSKPPIPRPWSRAILWAAAITLFIVLATAVINPLFDRVVNWGLLTIFAMLIFIALVSAFRRRWI